MGPDRFAALAGHLVGRAFAQMVLTVLTIRCRRARTVVSKTRSFISQIETSSALRRVAAQIIRFGGGTVRLGGCRQGVKIQPPLTVLERQFRT